MSDHDPLCPFSDTFGAPCMYCALIAKVRADERERERGRRIDRYDTTTIQEILSDEREALRAKVEALPVWRPSAIGNEYLLRDSVLALIDGSTR